MKFSLKCCMVCSSVLLFSVAIFRSVAIQLFCVETCSTSVPTPAGQDL